MFKFGFHRHKNLEKAIEELNSEVSDIRIQFASIRGKLAVAAREKRKSSYDAEVEAIKRQIDGDVVAVFDEKGKLIPDGD